MGLGSVGGDEDCLAGGDEGLPVSVGACSGAVARSFLSFDAAFGSTGGVCCFFFAEEGGRFCPSSGSSEGVAEGEGAEDAGGCVGGFSAGAEKTAEGKRIKYIQIIAWLFFSYRISKAFY